MRVYFFIPMEKIFIWVGHFRDKQDLQQYMATQNHQSPDDLIDDDEIAMSLFCEDIDLPFYDVATQQTYYFSSENELKEKIKEFPLLDKYLQNSKLVAPTPNALIMITGHRHTRYYRGAARPGAPVRFIACTERT